MFESLVATPHGPVQVVVVNHAISSTVAVPIATMSLERWNNIITTNLTSSFLVCREYLKHLQNAAPDIKEKAAIVLIGSTAGKYGEAGNGDYAATKSGQ
jgi:NAD(P)-dependent dehydrogenase (short-subunit alcohol dehydrogenase family)